MVPAESDLRWQEHGKVFKCPNGHKQGYISGKERAEKIEENLKCLKGELQATHDELARVKSDREQLEAKLQEATKPKRRTRRKPAATQPSE